MQVSTQMGPFSIVPEWVLNRGLSSTALKLYIVLARFADWETGLAFPGRETLAERMKSSEKTVDRAVKELVAAECIGKIFRGRYASALYKVYQVDPRPSMEQTDLSTEQTDLSREGTDLSSRPDKNVHITITNELEPLEQEPLNDIGVTEFDSKFNEWWSVYPNRKGKGAAKIAYKKALKKVSHDVLVDSARRYRDDPNREQQFTPYPQKWLNEERWEDAPEPVRQQKLTNAEKAVQLALKYRAQAEQERLALESNEGIIDIEDEPAFNGGWLKGIDDV